MAGLLHAAWRMAADARTPEISAELPALAARLAAQLSQPATSPGLLDGTAGAALALHSTGTGTAPAPYWDTFLAMA
jgi:lantibiotic biosynthesis protein